MATLVTCPTCKGMISSNANVCPHCGETEFTLDVYRKEYCSKCDGAGVIKYKGVMKEVLDVGFGKFCFRYNPSTFWYIAADDNERKKVKENNDFLEEIVAKGKYRFVQLGTTNDPHQSFKYPKGNFEWEIERPCYTCDGHGYFMKFDHTEDIRKPR